MKKLSLAIALVGSFFIYAPVFADVSQLDHSTQGGVVFEANGGAVARQLLGNQLSGTVTAISVWTTPYAGGGNPFIAITLNECPTNPDPTDDGSGFDDTGCTSVATGTFHNPTPNSQGTLTLGTPYTLTFGDYYYITVAGTGSAGLNADAGYLYGTTTNAYGNAVIWGNPGGSDPTGGTLTGVQNLYFILTGANIGPSGDGNSASHIVRVNTPEIGTTTGSTFPISIDYQQNHTENPVNGYTIDFGPASGVGNGSFVEMNGTLDPTLATGTYNISTTSPTLPDGSYLMRISLFTSLVGTLSGNIGSKLVTFSVNVNQFPGVPGFDATSTNYVASSTACAVSLSWNLGSCLTYLLIPSPNMFAAYGGLTTTLEGKIPFSYVYSIADTWNNLTASSTANSPTMTMNLHDLGIGSTTSMGNILPNFTFFSASTTEQYFPSGTFDLLKALASIALILGLFADIFFGVKNLIKT